ncbi:hypothetical protein C0993_003586 [Termitomyces sp. T159_Od127]|nr:hypothetical protein C0993_003586 [Termitomyces sp. T159_Od127]
MKALIQRQTLYQGQTLDGNKVKQPGDVWQVDFQETDSIKVSVKVEEMLSADLVGQFRTVELQHAQSTAENATGLSSVRDGDPEMELDFSSLQHWRVLCFNSAADETDAMPSLYSVSTNSCEELQSHRLLLIEPAANENGIIGNIMGYLMSKAKERSGGSDQVHRMT